MQGAPNHKCFNCFSENVHLDDFGRVFVFRMVWCCAACVPLRDRL